MKNLSVFALALLCSGLPVNALRASVPLNRGLALERFCADTHGGRCVYTKMQMSLSSDEYDVDDLLGAPKRERTERGRGDTGRVSDNNDDSYETQRSNNRDSSDRSSRRPSRERTDRRTSVQQTKWSEARTAGEEKPRAASTPRDNGHTIGDSVKAVVVRFGKLGASVDIYKGDNQIATGAFLMQ
jgi:predicted phage gp36 major capsid-like protein